MQRKQVAVIILLALVLISGLGLASGWLAQSVSIPVALALIGALCNYCFGILNPPSETPSQAPAWSYREWVCHHEGQRIELRWDRASHCIRIMGLPYGPIELRAATYLANPTAGKIICSDHKGEIANARLTLAEKNSIRLVVTPLRRFRSGDNQPYTLTFKVQSES